MSRENENLIQSSVQGVNLFEAVRVELESHAGCPVKDFTMLDLLLDSRVMELSDDISFNGVPLELDEAPVVGGIYQGILDSPQGPEFFRLEAEVIGDDLRIRIRKTHSLLGATSGVVDVFKCSFGKYDGIWTYSFQDALEDSLVGSGYRMVLQETNFNYYEGVFKDKSNLFFYDPNLNSNRSLWDEEGCLDVEW